MNRSADEPDARDDAGNPSDWARAASKAAVELAAAKRARDELVQAGRAPLVRPSPARGTHEAYERDWAGFVAWCERVRPTVPSAHPLPASDATLSLWLSHHAHLASATLGRRLAAVRFEHARAGCPLGRHALPRTRAAIRVHKLARGAGPISRAAAATEPVTARMVAAVTVRERNGMLAPLALRNRALLLVGYETALRCSELVGIRLEHLVRTSAGVRIAVPFSNGDPADHGAWVELLRRPGSDLCPVAALWAWRATLGRDEGPLFIALRRARYTGALGSRPLSARSVARIVSRAAKLAGLEGRFSAQSLRRGAIVDAMGPRM